MTGTYETASSSLALTILSDFLLQKKPGLVAICYASATTHSFSHSIRFAIAPVCTIQHGASVLLFVSLAWDQPNPGSCKGRQIECLPLSLDPLLQVLHRQGIL